MPILKPSVLISSWFKNAFRAQFHVVAFDGSLKRLGDRFYMGQLRLCLSHFGVKIIVCFPKRPYGSRSPDRRRNHTFQ